MDRFWKEDLSVQVLPGVFQRTGLQGVFQRGDVERG